MPLVLIHFDEEQSFTRRRPEWIKLYHHLLHNRRYIQLPRHAQALIHSLGLLASEGKKGVIDMPDEDIAFRIHWPIDEFNDGVKHLVQKGFLSYRNQRKPTREFLPSESESESESETERVLLSNIDTSFEDSPADLFDRTATVQKVPDLIEAAVAEYNRFAVGAGKTNWPQCEKITDKRRRGLKKLLTDKTNGGLEGWRAMLERAAASSWLNGTTPRGNGHENWKADIEYLSRETVFAEIMEGKHDDSPGSNQRRPRTSASAAVAGIARARPSRPA